jgi:hypothetical protein
MAQFDKMLRSLFQIKPFWPSGLDLASRVICRSVGFMKVWKRLDCDSSFVIYLGTCNKCRGQYVGKSQTSFKTHHSNYKQEIKKQPGGLGQHDGGPTGYGYQNFFMQIINQVELGEVYR